MTRLPAQEKPELTPSLRAAVRDRMGFAVMVGAGETYLSAFGIFLHATALQIAVLAMLPQLCGAFSQNIGVWFLERFKTRRPAIVRSISANAVIWFLIALLPFLFGVGTTGATALIVLAALYHSTAGFAIPLWNSLIRDLVPVETRGRFFGLRNQYIGIFTFLGVLVSGVILQLFQKNDRAAVGFTLIFAIAATARVVSAYWLGRYEDPSFEIRAEHRFTFFQFLRRAPRSNFARFVFFASTINFAVAFSGPFFTLFMLRELKFSYLEFTLVTAVMTVTQFLTMQSWERLGDRFGSKRILDVCGWGVCISPMLWLVSGDIRWIVLVQIYSGFVWAGFNLASTHFVFDAVTPQKLRRCVAYQAIVNGSFLLAGSLCGRYVATHAPASFVLFGIPIELRSNLLLIFFFSGLMRVVTAWYFLPRFREVRQVETIKHRDLIFLITNLRPIAGATFGVVASFFRDETPPPPQTPRGKKIENGHAGEKH